MAELSAIQNRLRALLMDYNSLVWSDDSLAEGVRQALGEYGIAKGSAVTVTGLDGAEVSTLDPLHESAVVWGAAGYCALMRAADASEAGVTYGDKPGGDAGGLRAWGDQRLKDFRVTLAVIFPAANSDGGGGVTPVPIDPDTPGTGLSGWGSWEDECTTSF